MDNIFDNIENFILELPENLPLLGLDVGEKTIGIAVSDTSKSVAVGIKTIFRTKFKVDSEEIREIILKRNVGGIILGFPINMNGTEGKRCQSTRAFAKNLSKITSVPISFWDERLSSVSANKILSNEKKSFDKRKKLVDQIAAIIILQSALDRMKNF